MRGFTESLRQDPDKGAFDRAMASLPPRQREVVSLIAEGRTNREIAERLVVSAATVKTHVNHIFAKAGVRDRAQAVVYAYSRGLAN